MILSLLQTVTVDITYQGFDQQMIVIAHQTTRMNGPVEVMRVLAARPETVVYPHQPKK